MQNYTSRFVNFLFYIVIRLFVATRLIGILIPMALASFERATTHPSLLLATHTGLFNKVGSINCSQDTKNESQSINAIFVVFTLISLTYF